jgi:hypothetical protein
MSIFSGETLDFYSRVEFVETLYAVSLRYRFFLNLMPRAIHESPKNRSFSVRKMSQKEGRMGKRRGKRREGEA